MTIIDDDPGQLALSDESGLATRLESSVARGDTLIDEDPGQLALPDESRLEPRLEFSAPRGGTLIDEDPGRLALSHESGHDPRLDSRVTRGDRLAIDPLRDAHGLAASIENLKALLHRERRLVEEWNAKLYESTTAGSAARRLMALKHPDRR